MASNDAVLASDAGLVNATGDHVVELTEWGTSDEVVELSSADEDTLDTEVNGEATRLEYQYDRDGNATFRARQFVGVVALPDGPTIQVRPKAAGNNLLYLLRYAQDVSPATIEQQTGLGQGDSFVDALAALFNRELQEILRRGLHSEYQTTSSEEKQLRGRLDIQRQLQRQGPVPTKFECTYDVLTTDTTANQAILYGTVILSRLVADDDLRQELEWHIAQLREAISLRPVQPAELGSIEVTRLNEYYADILRLVEPVLRNLHVDNLDVGQQQSFSLLVNMNIVYEQAIERAVKAAAAKHSGWEATGQARTTNLIHGTPTVRMYPDFVITEIPDVTSTAEPDTFVVGDAKWKTGSVSNDDIYQLTSYVLGREAPGLMFYPDQDGTVERSYEIDSEWPLQIVELPTADASTNFEDFRQTFEVAVEDALTDIITANDQG